MRYIKPPVPVPVTEFFPSKVYSSKQDIANVLAEQGLVIVDFRPPRNGDLWLMNRIGTLSTTLDTAFYGPNDPGGPARFIVKRIEPQGIPLDQAWE